jgi:hypothetical protein
MENPNVNDICRPPFIEAKQLAEILGRDIRTAQKLLKATREALGKGKIAYVSVKEFCEQNHLPEDETLEALKHMTPDFGSD